MASAVKFVSNNFLAELLKGNVDMDADTLKTLLVQSTNDMDDEDDNVGDITTLGELSVTGYTGGHGGAGRKTLSSITIAVDDGNNRATFAAADQTWTSLASGQTIKGAIFHRAGTASDADALLIGFWPADLPTNGGDVTLAYTGGFPMILTRATGS